MASQDFATSNYWKDCDQRRVGHPTYGTFQKRQGDANITGSQTQQASSRETKTHRRTDSFSGDSNQPDSRAVSANDETTESVEVLVKSPQSK